MTSAFEVKRIFIKRYVTEIIDRLREYSFEFELVEFYTKFSKRSLYESARRARAWKPQKFFARVKVTLRIVEISRKATYSREVIIFIARFWLPVTRTWNLDTYQTRVRTMFVWKSENFLIYFSWYLIN